MASKRFQIPDPSSSPVRSKRPRRSLDTFNGSNLSDIRLYVVQSKMDSQTVSDLISLAEEHGCSLCDSVEDANIVLTEVRMRKRLERHVDWELAVRRLPVHGLSRTDDQPVRTARASYRNLAVATRLGRLWVSTSLRRLCRFVRTAHIHRRELSHLRVWWP